MSATGLSADVGEYRRRLSEQSDEQIDRWAAELMRDMSIRLGVLSVLAEFRHATGLNDQGIRRVFAAGGGPPAVVGKTAAGELMVPAVSLHYLVTGVRQELKNARTCLTEYLALNFDELVYI